MLEVLGSRALRTKPCRLALGVVALIILCSCVLVGCRPGVAPPGDDGVSVAEEAQGKWQGCVFDSPLVTVLGKTATVASFVAVATTKDANGITELNVEGRYLGREDVLTRTLSSAGGSTVISRTIEAYHISHHVTAISNGAMPNGKTWADLDVWIPTDNIQLAEPYFGACCLAKYADSDGETGVWSYYVDGDMRREAEAVSPPGSISYRPYQEGGFHDLERTVLYVIYVIYMVPMTILGDYTKYGTDDLHRTSWGQRSPGSVEFSCYSLRRLMGDCNFTSWELSVSYFDAGGTRSTGFEASVACEMPLPFSFRVGGAQDDYIDFLLTSLAVGPV